MVRLFTFDERDELILNKEELWLFDEFRVIIQNDKGSPGDSEGRKKAYAKKIFRFIYLYCYFGSPFENMEDALKRKRSLLATGLTEKEVTTKEVLDAIELFNELQAYASITLPLLRALRKGYEGLKTHYERLDFSLRDNKGELVHSPTAFLAEVMKISKADDELKVLESKVMKEFAEDKGIRGSALKGVREDPD